MAKIIPAIFILTIIVFLPAGSAADGKPGEGRHGHEASAGDTFGQEPLVLAANEQNSDNSRSDSESNEKPKAPEEKKDPSKTITKPLKPFVPSEKVKAGQSVDFPYDI